MNIKVYVDVTAKFNSDGFLIPINLTWEDGQVFEIDRVTDIRQAAVLNLMRNAVLQQIISYGKTRGYHYEHLLHNSLSISSSINHTILISPVLHIIVYAQSAEQSTFINKECCVSRHVH